MSFPIQSAHMRKYKHSYHLELFAQMVLSHQRYYPINYLVEKHGQNYTNGLSTTLDCIAQECGARPCSRRR
jgi:hypothetical protein